MPREVPPCASAEKCKIEGAQNGSQLVLATGKPGEGRRGKRELKQGWRVVSGLVGPWAKRINTSMGGLRL